MELRQVGKLVVKRLLHCLSRTQRHTAMTESFKEVKRFNGLVGELTSQKEAIVVHCDSHGVIHLAKN